MLCRHKPDSPERFGYHPPYVTDKKRRLRQRGSHLPNFTWLKPAELGLPAEHAWLCLFLEDELRDHLCVPGKTSEEVPKCEWGSAEQQEDKRKEISRQREQTA